MKWRNVIRSLAILFPLLAFSQTPTPGPLVKTPAEQIDVSIDFTNRAASGITLAAVAATNTATNTDATSSIIVQAPSTPVPAVIPMTSKVAVRLKGGAVGDSFNVAVRVLKSDTGETLEGNVTLRIVAQQ